MDGGQGKGSAMENTFSDEALDGVLDVITTLTGRVNGFPELYSSIDSAVNIMGATAGTEPAASVSYAAEFEVLRMLQVLAAESLMRAAGWERDDGDPYKRWKVVGAR